MSIRHIIAASIGFAAVAFGSAAFADEVNLYSSRQEHLIRPLLDAFTKATGTTVNVVSAGEDALIERAKTEGANSPADVLITVDAGRLIKADQAGLFQPIKSPVLDAAIPAALRDPKSNWYGLSMRARVIFYSKERVKPEELSTYEALADPKWKGRICIRSSSNVYNQSMLSAFIVEDGAQKAEAWAKGIAANMARPPAGGDRDQILAVAAGVCDVAIANTYYYAGLLQSKKDEEKQAAQKVALFWPNQSGRGAHVNISGAGVMKNAPHKDAAVKLLEFLASDEAQRLYAEAVYEFPVKPGIAPSGVVAGFGKFKADTLSLAEIANHQAEAIRIFDRAGWR
ncbi:MAG: Fe(3+) ABC transporter substrate-binding protein [Alphaproteobacteria bacterium]